LQRIPVDLDPLIYWKHKKENIYFAKISEIRKNEILMDIEIR
jgi:hypothetical protein